MLQSESATAVGHIPSGLFIVTVKDSSGIVDGYLASWIQQVSFNPLMVSLAIRPGRPAYDLIKSGKIFAINVVGDHDKSFLKHFWKGYDPNSNPFDELPFELTQNGAVILNQAKSAMECVLKTSTSPGDHDIIFAEVLGSYVLNEEAKPMTHVRKSGANY
ncbi:MAG: flavin reductase family protein [Bacteriovoracaceae bacterium]